MAPFARRAPCCGLLLQLPSALVQLLLLFPLDTQRKLRLLANCRRALPQQLPLSPQRKRPAGSLTRVVSTLSSCEGTFPLTGPQAKRIREETPPLYSTVRAASPDGPDSPPIPCETCLAAQSWSGTDDKGLPKAGLILTKRRMTHPGTVIVRSRRESDLSGKVGSQIMERRPRLPACSRGASSRRWPRTK